MCVCVCVCVCRGEWLYVCVCVCVFVGNSGSGRSDHPEGVCGQPVQCGPNNHWQGKFIHIHTCKHAYACMHIQCTCTVDREIFTIKEFSPVA